MYGDGIKPRPLRVNRHDLEMMVERQAGQNVIFELVTGQEATPNVLLKDLQRDPVTDHAIHADFLKISMTQKLRVMVAVRLTGDPIGVTQSGGILEHQTRSVEVECLPADIIKEFVLDTSAMDIGGRLFVRDIPANPKLTIITPADAVIAAVNLPKLEEEEEKPAEEAVEGAEAAVEGEGEKKEGEKEAPAAPGQAAEAEKGQAKGQEKGQEKPQEKGKGKAKGKEQQK